MARFKKILKIGAIIIVVIILAAILYIRHLGHRALPDYNTDLDLKGFQDSVKIYRDQYAIPHVKAENESDLYRAFGYCMAQDRMWQMDLLRRVTLGRLAEIMGEDLVEYDLLMRSLQITEKSQNIYAKSNPEVRQALQAFSDGVNQYIEKQAGDLPLEFSLLQYEPEKWKPIHSINLIGYMAWSLTFPWENEVLLYKIQQKAGEKYKELIPRVSRQKIVVYPNYASKNSEIDILADLQSLHEPVKELGVDIFTASNNWAVAPEKSATEKPLFANDMHLGINSPGIWYQAHQMVTGKLNVTGVALPGAPFIVAGHNSDIAWGFTNVSVDDMDFYREKINPDNPYQYLLNGKWRDLKVKKETIRVKDSEPVEKELLFTHRGPIISRFKDIEKETISMRWVGNEESNEISSIYYVNRASNWQEFKTAMRHFRTVSQNVAYADTDGNIGLYSCTGIPIRKNGQGLLVRPGWTDEYDWQGLVPFEELPHIYNPENGFVASANNRTAGEKYPYYISHWFSPPYRIRRIRKNIKNKADLSIKDFKAIQNDHKSGLVGDMLPRLLDVLNKNNNMLKKREKIARDYLKEWDWIYTKGSVAASVFDQFYLSFLEAVAADELGDELFEKLLKTTYLPMYSVNNIWKNEESAWYDNVTTQGKRETFEEIVIRSFKKAVNSLENELGEDLQNWKWSKLHHLTLSHPLSEVKILDKVFDLNRGPYPLPGTFHTAGYYGYNYDKPFEVKAGASQRHIYNPANWDSSLSIIPTGNSGIPASRHYCDQSSLYVHGKYHVDHFSLSAVRKAARYEMMVY